MSILSWGLFSSVLPILSVADCVGGKNKVKNGDLREFWGKCIVHENLHNRLRASSGTHNSHENSLIR